jgi:hypothetical protein
MRNMNGATRLMRRGSIYYFRAKVPADLLDDYAPRKEIVKSLHTSDRREGERLVRVESVRQDQEFEHRRAIKKQKPIATLTPAHVARLSALYLSDVLQADEEARIRGLSGDELDAIDEGIDFGFDQFRPALASGDIKPIAHVLDSYLKDAGIAIERDSQQYREAAYAFLKAAIQATEVIEARQDGRIVSHVNGQRSAAVPMLDGAYDAGITLSETFERWRNERKPKAKTLAEWNLTVRRFIKLNGDQPVRDIKRVHVIRLKDAMLAEGKAIGTVKKQLGALRTVLQWARDNDHIEVNPADGVKPAAPKVEREKRLPYDADDLNKIFASPVFRENHRPAGGAGEAAYWLPLLALFTGARLEELGQLHCADLKESDGIHCLEISDRGDGKSVTS